MLFWHRLAPIAKLIASAALVSSFSNKCANLIVEKTGTKWLRAPFTTKPNVLFYASRRVGGGLANRDAIKLMKIST